MQDENNEIDQLEDQIIDHPDARTRKELGESLDETFQRKLNAKAEQINRGELDTDFNVMDDNVDRNMNFQFLVTKSHLDYKYSDIQSMQQEIEEWFTYSDLHTLGGLTNLINCYEQNLSDWNQIVALLGKNKLQDCSVLLKVVLYYSFGEYANKTSIHEQITQIKLNITHLLQLKIYQPLIDHLNQFISNETDNGDGEIHELSKQDESNYFKVLTIIYLLMLNVLDNPTDSSFRDYCIETNVLSNLTKFLEFWKWHKVKSYRIRYIILIINKLMYIELGGSTQIEACDEFLINLHNINKSSKNDNSTLTCSPLDYFAFREDLLDKYPLLKSNLKLTEFEESNDDIDKICDKFMAYNDFSTSLSSHIERPKTNKSNSVMNQLPTQSIHLATPIPSPKLMTSDYMSGGEKIRKSYQVNQSMPFIYPNDMTNESIPIAIKEADEIYRKSIYESYSIKRLWSEREKFMKQERDNEPTTLNDEFDYDFEKLYSKYPENKSQISSIERVEHFYSQNLSRLHTIIEVFIEIINTNRLDFNLNLAESELDPKTSSIKHSTIINQDERTRTKIENIIFSQLEVLNVKEITLKSSLNTILMMLKWFKISHVLKYCYLTSLLFDQKFFNISLEYLGRSFNNPNIQNEINDNSENGLNEYELLINQNKLMNPKINLPKRTFFNNCLNHYPSDYKYQFINQEFISKLAIKLDCENINHITIKNYNDNFAHILVNILEIIDKTLLENQSHRLFAFNDLKPSEIYKMILINYENDSISPIIMKTLKKLVPYQGRKWKSINMDLISQIYLNLKLTLKDNWLSGRDIESDFNSKYDQEIALRGLLQFYNMSRYEKEMEKVGYRIERVENIPQLSSNNEPELKNCIDGREF